MIVALSHEIAGSGLMVEVDDTDPLYNEIRNFVGGSTAFTVDDKISYYLANNMTTHHTMVSTNQSSIVNTTHQDGVRDIFWFQLFQRYSNTPSASDTPRPKAGAS